MPSVSPATARTFGREPESSAVDDVSCYPGQTPALLHIGSAAGRF